MKRRNRNKEWVKAVGKKRGLPFRNPITGLRVSQALDKVQSLVGTASEVAHAINEIGSTPKLRNYIAVGTIGLSKLVEANEFNPQSNDNFRALPVYDFQGYLRRVCENAPNTRMFGSGSSTIQVTELHGETFVFTGSAKESEAYYMFRPDDDDQEGKLYTALGRAVWEQTGYRIELLLDDEEVRGGGAKLKAWDLGEVLNSPQTDDLQERISMFLDEGARRSVLLHGPPGTGKSSMARAIAASLNLPTLFIDASQIKYLAASTLTYCLDLLHPYVIIIDDLDRIFEVSGLLSSIDRIRANAVLFVVTANDLSSFDAAVVRAGRFDEVVPVERVKSPRDMIANLPEDVATELDAWPVAFVEELRVRLEVLGEDCLDAELQRLRARVQANEVSIQRNAEMEITTGRRRRRR